jgi:arylsulfatase
VLDLPHSIRADPEIPPEGAEGVLICQGSAAGGWSFYLQDSRLHYAHNYVGRHVYKVSSPDPVGAGGRQLRFEFEPTGEPDVAHGKGARPRPALRGRHPRRPDRHSGHHARHVQSGWDDLRRQPWRAGDTRLPQPVQVHRDLHRVTVDLSGDLIIDAESEMRLAMTRQ